MTAMFSWNQSKDCCSLLSPLTHVLTSIVKSTFWGNGSPVISTRAPSPPGSPIHLEPFAASGFGCSTQIQAERTQSAAPLLEMTLCLGKYTASFLPVGSHTLKNLPSSTEERCAFPHSCLLSAFRYWVRQKVCSGDFSGGPVAKTPSSQCRGLGFSPWLGN